jgi:hypothetical protein
MLTLPVALLFQGQGTPEALAAGLDRHLVTGANKSDIASWFRDLAIVPETHERACRAPVRTWKIGDIPKCGPSPALFAGLNAISITCPAMWRLEHQQKVTCDGPGRLVALERCDDLVPMMAS